MSQYRIRRLALIGVVALIVGAAAVITATHAGADESKFRSQAGPDAIPNSYLVVYQDAAVSSRDVKSTSQDLTEEYGGTVAGVWSTALRGFSAAMSEKEAKDLAGDDRVAFVEQNVTVRQAETQPNPANQALDRVDQANLPLDKAYTFTATGEDVTVFVIDSGINAEHTDFGERATVGTDVIGDGLSGQDCNGHGTHVSGIAGGTEFGAAKTAKIVAVRALDCTGSGSSAGILDAIDFVTQNAETPSVANLSIGGTASGAIDAAVEAAINAGITFVIAAGNDADDACNFSPSRVKSAIVVGSTSLSDVKSDFSNSGECVDIFAPGEDIVSATIGDDNEATTALTGTSMSTPLVTGAAAIVLSAKPDLTPAEVEAALVNCATSDKVTNAGESTPNKLLFISEVCTSGGTPPTPPEDDPTPEPTCTPTAEGLRDGSEAANHQAPTAPNPATSPREGPAIATDEPTEEPTDKPTGTPTEEPSEEPTDEPTEEPTDEPTEEPTDEPTVEPTEEPTEQPTDDPTLPPCDDESDENQ